MLDNVAPPGTDLAELKGAIQQQLATAFELPAEAVFAPDLAMGAIIAASPKLVNSVDFMEACAKVANFFKKSYGVAVRLPATTLDTPVSAIVDSFVTQAAKGTASAGGTAT